MVSIAQRYIECWLAFVDYARIFCLAALSCDGYYYAHEQVATLHVQKPAEIVPFSLEFAQLNILFYGCNCAGSVSTLGCESGQDLCSIILRDQILRALMLSLFVRTERVNDRMLSFLV